MIAKPESTGRSLARSIAMGVLLSMFFFYSIHVLGSWQIQHYRPDPETTSTILLHNKCAVFGKTHTLRPNTDVSGMGKGIDGVKLGGSFMNFFDGHIAGLVVFSGLTGGLIFLIRSKRKKKGEASPSLKA